MLFTDVQRSVRLNKKKKSTNTSPYLDEVIDRLTRAFYPAILACWNSEEGQREFAAWQAEQAHHAPSNEKQSVPAGELPALLIVCGFLQGVSSRAHPVFCFSWKTLRLLPILESGCHSNRQSCGNLLKCSAVGYV